MPRSAKRWTRPSILPIPTSRKGTALDTLSEAQIHHIMDRLRTV